MFHLLKILNLNNRINNIFNTPLVKNTAKMSLSNIIMYMLPIVVTPILTRLYTPDAFGEWGVFSSFVAIASIGIFLGFENVIIQAKEKLLSDVIVLCLTLSICLIVIIYVVFWGGKILEISFFINFPNIELLVIYLFLYCLYIIFFNLNNRYEQYNTLSFANIVKGCSQGAFRIILAFLCLQAINGLILGTTIAEGLTALFLFLFLLKTPCKDLKIHFHRNRLKHLLSQYKKFPLYDAPSSILSFSAFNLPVIILSLYFNKTEIGCFSIILQLLLMPMSLIGSAIGKVYYQRLCSLNGNANDVSTATDEVLRILVVISIFPLLFIACGGDKLIILFLGSQWQTAGNVALCLALWSFPTILTQPLLPLFRVLYKQQTLLLYDSLYFLFGVGSILLFCKFTNNLYLILIAFSSACFVVKFLLFEKIITISQISLKSYIRILPLWGVALIVLILRLFFIFEPN